MKEHISYFPVNKLSMDSLMQFLDKRERILGERIEIFYKDPMFSDWSNAQRQPLEAAVLHYIAEIRFLRRWLKKHFTD